MGKLIANVMTSLDGYFEGPGEGWERIAFHRADDEWIAYSNELLSSVTQLVFGRRTYEGFAEYWPTQEDETARLLNALPKTVVSRSLEKASWAPTTVARDPRAIADLKAKTTGDLLVMGSADLVASLIPLGLVDEHRLAIVPCVLGGGTPYFRPDTKLELDRREVRLFASGVTEVRCVPRR